MRLRYFASAAFLCSLLIPWSQSVAIHGDNPAVDRALLRALIVQRHGLVAALAAQNRLRGQLLTLGALATADAILSSDQAALGRDIVRLSRPGAPASRRPVHRQRHHTRQRHWRQHSRHDVAMAPASLVDAPGVLSAPGQRVSVVGTPAWSSATTLRSQSPRAAATVHPAVGGVPGPSIPPVQRHSLAPAAIVPARAPALPVDAVDRAPAPAYGRLVLDSGTGAIPVIVANDTVAAAITVPLSVPGVPRRAEATHRRRGAQRHSMARQARHTRTPRAPQQRDRAALLQQWRLVSAALARVRALERWAYTSGPDTTVTGNDVIPTPEMLHRRIDRWTAHPALNVSPVFRVSLVPSVVGRAPDVAPGATLLVSTTLTTSVTDAATLRATLAQSGTLAAAQSRIVSVTGATAPPAAITAPVTLASLAAISATISPTGTGTIDSAPVISATGVMSAAGAITTALPLSTTLVGDAPPTAMAPLTATAPLTAAFAAMTAPLPPVSGLTIAVEGSTAVMTVTMGAPAAGRVASPSILVVRLPARAAQALAPPGFQSRRGALESVLRQGQILFARLRASAGAVEAGYRTRLNAVVALNASLERHWYAQVYAYNAYLRGLAAYRQRVADWNAYAHQIHVARIRHDLWAQRLAAWTQYARDLKVYRDAVARQGVATGPVSGTVAISATVPGGAAPPRPVAPPFPGPEPAPFTGPSPAWPGSPPAPVPAYGPEPRGYPLPAAPDAVPTWDNDAVAAPVPVVNYGGMIDGVNAAGREETTRDALVAAGALDGVGSYQDPLRGVITTYWGGSTPFQSFHPALDIAPPEYTPIHAAAGGLVVWAGYAVPGQRHYSYGLCVIIKHNRHFSTLYAHMDDERYGLQVHAGEIVQQGQVIGYEGMTGFTTGPHLHFEMRQDGIEFDPLLLIPNPQA